MTQDITGRNVRAEQLRERLSTAEDQIKMIKGMRTDIKALGQSTDKFDKQIRNLESLRDKLKEAISTVS
jgi:DNA repair exonuclease SbcCD ATPase subunit